MWGEEGGTEVRGKNRHVIHVDGERRQAFFFSTALSATSERMVLLQVGVGRRAASLR